LKGLPHYSKFSFVCFLLLPSHFRILARKVIATDTRLADFGALGGRSAGSRQVVRRTFCRQRKLPFFDVRKFTIKQVFRSPTSSPSVLSDMRSRGGSQCSRSGPSEARGSRAIASPNCCKSPSTARLMSASCRRRFALAVRQIRWQRFDEVIP
jgi:hypothetical protein